MPRSMVGLLVAVGAAMSALAGIVHGDFVALVIAHAAAAAGLAAYLTLPDNKKICDIPHGTVNILSGMSHDSIAPCPPDRCYLAWSRGEGSRLPVTKTSDFPEMIFIRG